MRTQLFVYGTLMTGLRLNWLLRACGATLRGPAAITGYRMVNRGHCPGIVPFWPVNPDHAIKGEVWEVPALFVWVLDFVEHAYIRTRTRTADRRMAEVYELIPGEDWEELPVVANGDWRTVKAEVAR